MHILYRRLTDDLFPLETKIKFLIALGAINKIKLKTKIEYISLERLIINDVTI